MHLADDVQHGHEHMHELKLASLFGPLLLLVACGDSGSSSGGGGAAGGAGGDGGGGNDLCADVNCNDANPCTQDVCEPDGSCTHPAAVVVTLMQVDGDCAESVCEGTELVSTSDPGDTPIDDGNECTDETCSGGAPQHPPVADGTSCGDGGSCEAGLCVETGCTTDGDCVDGDLDQCDGGECVDCDDTGGCEAPETCNLATQTCE